MGWTVRRVFLGIQKFKTQLEAMLNFNSTIPRYPIAVLKLHLTFLCIRNVLFLNESILDLLWKKEK